MSERAKVERRHEDKAIEIATSRTYREAAQLLADFEAEAERRGAEKEQARILAEIDEMEPKKKRAIRRTCVWICSKGGNGRHWTITPSCNLKAAPWLYADVVGVKTDCPYCGGRIVTAPASEEE